MAGSLPGTSYMVPQSHGATMTRDWEEALWQAVFMAQPEQRERSRRAPSVASDERRPGQTLWPEPNHCHQWRARTTTLDAPMGPTATVCEVETRYGPAGRQP